MFARDREPGSRDDDRNMDDMDMDANDDGGTTTVKGRNGGGTRSRRSGAMSGTGHRASTHGASGNKSSTPNSRKHK